MSPKCVFRLCFCSVLEMLTTSSPALHYYMICLPVCVCVCVCDWFLSIPSALESTALVVFLILLELLQLQAYAYFWSVTAVVVEYNVCDCCRHQERSVANNSACCMHPNRTAHTSKCVSFCVLILYNNLYWPQQNNYGYYYVYLNLNKQTSKPENDIICPEFCPATGSFYLDSDAAVMKL